MQDRVPYGQPDHGHGRSHPDPGPHGTPALVAGLTDLPVQPGQQELGRRSGAGGQGQVARGLLELVQNGAAPRTRRDVLRQDTLRLAGNTLVWEQDGVTMRLEAQVTKEQALRIAGTFR